MHGPMACIAPTRAANSAEHPTSFFCVFLVQAAHLSHAITYNIPSVLTACCRLCRCVFGISGRPVVGCRAVAMIAVPMAMMPVVVVVAWTMVQRGLACARSCRALGVLTLEAIQRAVVLLQQLLQLGVDLNLLVLGQAAVVVERPELLQAVQAAAVKVPARGVLELAVQVQLELLLQAVAVEPEQALHAVVVVGLRVLLRQLAEALVHGVVEVVAQEVAPEAEQRVHLLAQADAHLLAVLDAPLVVLGVLHLLEPVVLQQRVAGVLELGDGQGRGQGAGAR
mmetsp:Transcript_34535/g.87307  ORF Transcript_34535/g.87307 Transcript_34535/m.87307 type:complete len:281 (-) Transcript_34535:2448-3290(-)